MTAKLESPSHVVIGSTDIRATVAFFTAVDFAVQSTAGDTVTMSRGLGHRTDLLISRAPATDPIRGYDLGPRGLDMYTTDLEASVAAATSAGGTAGPVAAINIGPMTMRQVTVWGPDGIPLVLIENETRRSSLLDEHPDERHSEIHSLVWAVADRDTESAWWAERGLVKGMDIAFGDPAVAEFMRLPDTDVTLEMVMLANEANDPIRFELMQFAGREGSAFAGADGAGIQAIGFDAPVESDQRLVSPGGVVVSMRSTPGQ